MNEQPQILVVDDEVHIRKSLSRLFRMHGFLVLLADSAPRALELLAAHPVDIVVSDYWMPEMSGLDLMIQIKKEYPEVIRILLTAHSEKGVLVQAINQGEIYRFFDKPWDDEALLTSVSEAVSSKKSRVRESDLFRTALRQSNIETVMAIAEAVELKDPYTKGHCTRVREFSVRLGHALGIPLEWMPHLIYGALLHDCGKIGIEESILLKPGRLSEDQKKIIQHHSVLGFELMNSVSHLKTASLFVRQHHERWDGKGYPDGLRKEQSHICSRIIAIADAYDAMTSDRPYRKGLPVSKAREVLLDNRGTQFDPELVNVFVSLLDADRQSGRDDPPAPALLFIDHDQQSLEFMAGLFEDAPYGVETARDAGKALEILGRSPIDIIICQRCLGEASGLELLSEVKFRYPGATRILLSDPDMMMESVVEADVYTVIPNPFTGDEARGIIENAIEWRQMARSVGAQDSPVQ